LLLEQEVLRHHRSYSTGATQLRGPDGEVKQGEPEVPDVRVSVGQMSGVAQRCSILDSARELAIRDPQERMKIVVASEVAGTDDLPRIVDGSREGDIATEGPKSAPPLV
jgi:hypothetical protein